MGLFRKLADFARRSNDKWCSNMADYHNQKRYQEEAEQLSKSYTKCCANCIYYSDYYNECLKHKFKYSLDDLHYNEIHYKRVCNDFFWEDATKR